MERVDPPTGSEMEETLAVFDQLDAPCTPLTAGEVAEQVDCSRSTASETLEELVERGSLKTRTTGTGCRVWWRPATTRRAIDSGERTPSESASLGAFVRAVEEYAIFTLDPDGRITSWNEGARRIKGYERDEVLGEHISMFYTEADRERAVPDQNLERAANVVRAEDEGWRVRKDGSEFWANVVITAVRDDDGTLLGFTKVTRDMTDTREHERDREQTEELLKTSPVAISVQNAAGETVLANERAQELLELSEEEIIEDPEDVDEWGIYDADGEPLDPEETPAARVLRTGEPVYDEVIAIERPGGERMWLSVNAAPVFGPDGELERVVSAGEDITRIKAQARRIEHQRDELQHQLTEVFGRVTDALFGLDEEWRITHANTRAEEILEWTDAEVVGEVVWKASPEIGELLDRETLREAVETGETRTYERHFPPDSTWFEIRIYPSETGVSVYFTDVTERKEHELELERYRRIVETIDDGIYILDDDGRFTMVNGAYAEMTGYSREELLGSPASMVVEEETVETAQAVQQELLVDEREAARVEADVLTATGGTIRAEATFAILSEDSGVERIGVVRDVSDRVERERELEEQRKRYRGLVETAPVSIAIHDAHGDLVYVNDAAAELVGAADTEVLLGRPAIEFLHHEDRPEAAACVRRVIEERTASEPKEARIVGFGGEIRHIVLTSVPIRYRGEPAAQVVLTDITERKEREEALKRYETVFETVDDGIYVLGADAHFEEVNDAYAEMTGYSKEELVGSHCSLVVGEDVSDLAAERSRELASGERATATIEADVLTKDGDRIPGESKVTSLDTEDGEFRGSVGVVRDLTDRVERERELETRVRQQQVVTELGRRALEDPELDVLFDEAVEAVADTLGNDYCKVLELFSDDEELLLRSGCGWKDGYVGEATVGTEIESQAGYTLVSREPIVVDDMSTEERFSGPDLLTEHDVVSGISTIIGPFHDPWGVLGTHDTAYREFTQHDVNFVQAVANVLTNAIERDHYERRLTRTIDELKESNDRLEQFAYIASHDLQEPLRMISNYLRLLEDRYRDALDDDAEEFIDYAVDGADRMREMIDDLLTYSRVERHSDSLEPTDTEAVVTRVLDNLQLQIEELDAEVAVGTLPTVSGDDKLLEQLFQNLVSNALKYRGDEPPRVEIGATRHGDQWLFRVADNGIGIEPDYTDRIFEVFKRLHTREEYPGTGIGLTLCKRIVDRHGGEIWVDSEPGEGSTFYFTLPSEGGHV